jgi:hypothetical protein
MPTVPFCVLGDAFNQTTWEQKRFQELMEKEKNRAINDPASQLSTSLSTAVKNLDTFKSAAECNSRNNSFQDTVRKEQLGSSADPMVPSRTNYPLPQPVPAPTSYQGPTGPTSYAGPVFAQGPYTYPFPQGYPGQMEYRIPQFTNAYVPYNTNMVPSHWNMVESFGNTGPQQNTNKDIVTNLLIVAIGLFMLDIVSHNNA